MSFFALLDMHYLLLAIAGFRNSTSVNKAGGYFGIFASLVAFYIAASGLYHREYVSLSCHSSHSLSRFSSTRNEKLIIVRHFAELPTSYSQSDLFTRRITTPTTTTTVPLPALRCRTPTTERTDLDEDYSERSLLRNLFRFNSIRRGEERRGGGCIESSINLIARYMNGWV